MSTNRVKFGIEYNVNVGTEKELFATIIDPDTNLAKSLSDTNVYATALAKIYKPDGTQIGDNMTVVFEDRPNGVVSFIVTDTHSAIANAGNWIGEIEFSNITPKKIDQQFFNINILESY